MPRLEIIEVIIHPNRQTDDNESDLAFRRVQLGLEYCGFIFRSIGSMRAANRCAAEGAPLSNIREHLENFDDELRAMASIGDAFAGFTEEAYGSFIEKYVDAPLSAAQNSTQLAT